MNVYLHSNSLKNKARISFLIGTGITLLLRGPSPAFANDYPRLTARFGPSPCSTLAQPLNMMDLVFRVLGPEHSATVHRSIQDRWKKMDAGILMLSNGQSLASVVPTQDIGFNSPLHLIKLQSFAEGLESDRLDFKTGDAYTINQSGKRFERNLGELVSTLKEIQLFNTEVLTAYNHAISFLETAWPLVPTASTGTDHPIESYIFESGIVRLHHFTLSDLETKGEIEIPILTSGPIYLTVVYKFSQVNEWISSPILTGMNRLNKERTHVKTRIYHAEQSIRWLELLKEQGNSVKQATRTEIASSILNALQ